MAVALLKQMFKGSCGTCDQEEYSGKKSPIGKNVKDKEIGAEGWYSPWILPTDFCCYHERIYQ